MAVRPTYPETIEGALVTGRLEKEGDVAYVLCPYCRAACICELVRRKDNVYVLKCKVCFKEFETEEPKYYVEATIPPPLWGW